MKTNSIPLVNLQRQHEFLRGEMRSAMDGVLDRGDFILGREVAAFESEFAAYCGAKHCIGVGNGMDALTLALKAMGIGPGDEVITAGNTFIATALAIHHVGATPVLVDHEPDSYNLDSRRLTSAITSRTKAILPVHLYGRPADMYAIRAVANEHEIDVIEDACQSHGAKYKGRRTGSLGRAAAFSFYPGKNLGGLGDGGAIVTNDDGVADWLRATRNYGSKVKYQHTHRGLNSRLDSLQAAVLRAKLRRLDEWNNRRASLAERYGNLLRSTCGSAITLPLSARDGEYNSAHHLFVIRCANRDHVLGHLKARGIEAGVHYPIPIHLQEAMAGQCVIPKPLRNTEACADEILSLPLCPFITETEVDFVAKEVAAAVSASCQVASVA